MKIYRFCFNMAGNGNLYVGAEAVAASAVKKRQIIVMRLMICLYVLFARQRDNCIYLCLSTIIAFLLFFINCKGCAQCRRCSKAVALLLTADGHDNEDQQCDEIRSDTQ